MKNRAVDSKLAKTDARLGQRNDLQPCVEAIHMGKRQLVGSFTAMNRQIPHINLEAGNVPMEGSQLDPPIRCLFNVCDDPTANNLLERLAAKVPGDTDDKSQQGRPHNRHLTEAPPGAQLAGRLRHFS